MVEYPPLILGEKYRLIFQGAEAKVYLGSLYGLKVILKWRFPKKYRIDSLDRIIRFGRTKREVRSMIFARDQGVPTPFVFDVFNDSIVMEYIDGIKLHEYIAKTRNNEIVRKLASSIYKLHCAGITHNDLTVHNILIQNNTPFIIDFGLSKFTHRIEDFAIDLLVFKGSLISSLNERGVEIFLKFSDSYKRLMGKNSNSIFRRIKLIEKRHRHVMV